MRYFFGWLAMLLLCAGCIQIDNPYPKMAPGIWRAELQLERPAVRVPDEDEEEVELRFDERTQGSLPFLFELVYEKDSIFALYLINGAERIYVPPSDISYGYDRSIARDTLRVEFPIYNSYITGEVEGGFIEGEWIDRNRGDYQIPFSATFGQDHRFTTLEKTPAHDISGRWAVTFSPGTEAAYPAVGEFQLEGNHLTGTFLTETGDYRYLSGTMQGDKLYLSTFDGSHAFLFEGKWLEEGTITGSFRSGKHYQTTWEARPDPDAQLSSADSLLAWQPIPDLSQIRFANRVGDTLSLESPAFAQKVRLVQILGTWCPNCRDETTYLANLLKKEAFKEVAAIGLAFEKVPDAEAAYRQIDIYRERLDVPYPIVYAGPLTRQRTVPQLSPLVEKVTAYPTLIVIDKQGRVRKVHSGFSGPATSGYEAFTEELEALLMELL